MATICEADVLSSLTHLNVSTTRTYLHRIDRLKEELGVSSIVDVMLSPERYIPQIDKAGIERDQSLHTRRNRATTLLALFRHAIDRGVLSTAPNGDNCIVACARRQWAEYFETLKVAERAAYALNEPTSKRVHDSYVSISEIRAALEKKGEGGCDGVDTNGITPLGGGGHATLKESMETTLLAIYASMPPKRADLGEVRVWVRGSGGVPDAHRANINYVELSVPPGSSTLVLNKHKTAGTCGAIVELLDAATERIIRQSIEMWPRHYLFVNAYGSPMTPNCYSKYVTRVMSELFGRRAGTTLLRHAYVSECMDFNKLSMKDREDVARRMGHSVATQGAIYKWVDVPVKDTCSS